MATVEIRIDAETDSPANSEDTLQVVKDAVTLLEATLPYMFNNVIVASEVC